MAFIQASASVRERAGDLLSADNGLPERHILMALLRKVGPRLGLGAPVLATLDAMLSCLPPKRNHHTVFASNATLSFRLNGISERTIRRHTGVLQEAGLLIRRDSANRKRFVRHNAQVGKVLRFGFDLTPLFERLPEIARQAAEVTQEQETLAYLRTKIRAAATAILDTDPEHEAALAARRMLRRKLSIAQCETLLDGLSTDGLEAETEVDPVEPGAREMTGKDGQNVRHHHRSKTEITDKKAGEMAQPVTNRADTQPISVAELLAACPDAVQFSPGEIKTPRDVIAHARTLAPMIGIDDSNYRQAQDRLGPLGAAATVWALMQFHDRINRVGAYFRSITSGTRSRDFDPFRLVRRLALSQGRAA
ncbi:MAG: replication protein C [Rhodobacteraceae bacterium]|nr:MAG: replication protein C [Paracoccaceae bacterium]